MERNYKVVKISKEAYKLVRDAQAKEEKGTDNLKISFRSVLAMLIRRGYEAMVKDAMDGRR